MALHWKDVEGKEATAFLPGDEIGFDISLELINRYDQKTMLVDRALRLGYYMGITAEQKRKGEII